VGHGGLSQRARSRKWNSPALYSPPDAARSRSRGARDKPSREQAVVTAAFGSSSDLPPVVVDGPSGTIDQRSLTGPPRSVDPSTNVPGSGRSLCRPWRSIQQSLRCVKRHWQRAAAVAAPTSLKPRPPRAPRTDCDGRRRPGAIGGGRRGTKPASLDYSCGRVAGPAPPMCACRSADLRNALPERRRSSLTTPLFDISSASTPGWGVHFHVLCCWTLTTPDSGP